MSEEKFSKCEEGGKRKKNVSVEFRVFGKKKEIGRKVPRKKKSKCFFFGENFAKFVFTGWVLC